MSLDKSIEHGKEKRKQYFDSRAVDKSCRSHGGCFCNMDRLLKDRKAKISAEEQIKELTEDV